MAEQSELKVCPFCGFEEVTRDYCPNCGATAPGDPAAWGTESDQVGLDPELWNRRQPCPECAVKDAIIAELKKSNQGMADCIDHDMLEAGDLVAECDHLREQVRVLREALEGVKNSNCWCERGVGNPMVTTHSPSCQNATMALAATEEEKT
jgi:hypothetical protein